MPGWLRRLAAGRGWDGRSGRPRSANAASSFHLVWQVPDDDWVAAGAVLEVLEPPRVAELYFWALQVSFDEGGRAGGGAHLGLQWYPPHPGSTAVNWGGYAAGGGELPGTTSALPSAVGNPNTRDFAWEARRPYRLSVRRVGPADELGRWAWRGAVTDVRRSERTPVRDLFCAGSRIRAPMVWSEVFAPCDAPGAVVRWSELTLERADGTELVVDRVAVNYQRVDDGGCVTTDSSVDGRTFVQRTGTVRSTPQGSVLVATGGQASRS